MQNVFDGENGYQEARGQKMNMQPEQLKNLKRESVQYGMEMELDRIEPIEGVSYYVIKFNKSKYFIMLKQVKIPRVKTVKSLMEMLMFQQYLQITKKLMAYYFHTNRTKWALWI